MFSARANTCQQSIRTSPWDGLRARYMKFYKFAPDVLKRVRGFWFPSNGTIAGVVNTHTPEHRLPKPPDENRKKTHSVAYWFYSWNWNATIIILLAQYPAHCSYTDTSIFIRRSRHEYIVCDPRITKIIKYFSFHVSELRAFPWKYIIHYRREIIIRCTSSLFIFTIGGLSQFHIYFSCKIRYVLS